LSSGIRTASEFLARAAHVPHPGLAIVIAVLMLALAAPANAAFPGQNGKLVYPFFGGCSPPTHCVYNLYAVNPDGSGRTRLTNASASDQRPAWSPDGSKIVFSSNRDGNFEIYVINADGTNPQRLTVDPALDSNPAWSPDGSKVVFDSNRGGSTGVYAMNGDGTNPAMLADHGGYPAWSPDGSKIAFSDGAIWVMNADGTSKRMVTPGGDPIEHCGGPVFEYSYGPDWSPSGDRLAFVKYILDPCNDGDAAYAFETIDPDGSQGEDVFFYTGEGCGPGPPVWSPDGSKIAFTYCSLREVNPDGSDLRTIDSTCCGIGEADWQPIANRPPDCSGVTSTPNLLWPPDRRFRTVELAGASDPDGDEVTLEITGVTQDEPVGGGRDAYGLGDNLARLRAERDPRGDGRAYRIAFTVTDAEGAQCEGTANVSVPRKRKQPAVDSAPPSYDSFGG
jgi:dipeptidyl aminopeptidase/acylaminoacyl peptidase